jgi:hypothetical protein
MGTAGMVGVLGTPCSPVGALACAGNYQKLTVFCNGDGEWEVNETCGTDLVCESTPGVNVGTCQPIAAECQGGPGTGVCDDDDKTLVRCSADATTTTSETCSGGCHNGECHDVSACPVWGDYDGGVSCSLECGRAASGACVPFTALPGCTAAIALNVDLGDKWVVRTPWADETCQGCGATPGIFVLDIRGNGGTQYLRMTVPAPWRLASQQVSDCRELLDECGLFRRSQAYVFVVPTTLADGPVNIVIEGVDSAATCP